MNLLTEDNCICTECSRAVNAVVAVVPNTADDRALLCHDCVEQAVEMLQGVPTKVVPIELEEYEPCKDQNGYDLIRYVQGRLLSDIKKELMPHIEPMCDEYFDLAHDQKGKRWPRHRWVACYAVTGGSEGHYVHVDAILPDCSTRVHLFTGKTFQGFEHARRIANRCADLLSA